MTPELLTRTPGLGSEVQALHEPAKARPGSAAQLEAVWVRHQDELRAAQRLRWQVFAQELGARLKPVSRADAGHDIDAFDPWCEHLIVRTKATAEGPSRVVGTYRLLTPQAARRAGSLYAEGEFDLSPLDSLRGRTVELGRSCVDPAWRHGGVILMLWASLAQFMAGNKLDFMIGCASVPMQDGGLYAASLWQALRTRHLAAAELRVKPHLPLPVDTLAEAARLAYSTVEPPALIKGYLACGAQLLGPPAWDPDFGCADLPMMLDLGHLPAAYRRRFLGDLSMPSA